VEACFTLDAGVGYGKEGNEGEKRDTFVIPMGGVGYYW
jgi:hypothetical protein